MTHDLYETINRRRDVRAQFTGDPIDPGAFSGPSKPHTPLPAAA